MHIAYFYDSVYPFSKGGGERRIYEIASRLLRRGHQIHILGMKYWDGPATFEQDGIHYHGVASPTSQYHPSGRRSIRQALQFGAQSWRLLTAKHSLDILDCGQWPYFHFLPALAYSRLHSTRFLVSWYEVWGQHWYDYLGAGGLAGLLVERSFCRLPDRLIAVSEMTRQRLIAAGAPASRIEMIPNGIDYQKIRTTPPGPVHSDIVCCGRLKNHKNVDILLRAVALMAKVMPTVTATIVGDGPERPRLEQMACDLGIKDRVTFTGALDDFRDLVAIMKASSIFVNASTKEGGGSITLFEANACGLPVIAVRCPNGIDPRLIREGENGFLVDHLSPAVIASKVLELLHAPDLLRKMSEASIRTAMQYDWDVIAERHEELYLSLINRKFN